MQHPPFLLTMGPNESSWPAVRNTPIIAPKFRFRAAVRVARIPAASLRRDAGGPPKLFECRIVMTQPQRDHRIR